MTAELRDLYLPDTAKADNLHKTLKTLDHVQAIYGRRTGIHGNTHSRPRRIVFRSMESSTLGKGNRGICPCVRNILDISRYHADARCCTGYWGNRYWRTLRWHESNLDSDCLRNDNLHGFTNHKNSGKTENINILTIKMATV